MGQLAGDGVRRQVADVLKDVAGPENLVGRVGGDEFVVFVKTEQDRARETAEKILAGIQNITVEGRNSTRISGSVGIAIAPRDGRDYYALLKRADACLYQAKSEGNDRWYGEKDGQENITKNAPGQPGKLLWGVVAVRYRAYRIRKRSRSVRFLRLDRLTVRNWYMSRSSYSFRTPPPQ